jgi:hypothetical protein
MAYQLWSQDIFSRGELSPYMYARATVNEYGNGLKIAQNVFTYPTGAAGKRFGTFYRNTLTGFTSAKQIYFQSFQYVDECVYQLVFAPLAIYIYLEGGLVATVTTTLDAETVYNLSTTTLGNLFRVCGAIIAPYDLKRASDPDNDVTGFSSTTLTLHFSTTYTGLVIPISFTVTGGTLIQTTPQINVGVTYFAYFTGVDTFELYLTPQEAAARASENKITIDGLGTGTTVAHTQNTWTFTNTVFKDLPFYDFNGTSVPYDDLTFTPNNVNEGTMTISGTGYGPLDSSYVGGAFIGGGGAARITSVASATEFNFTAQVPFDSTSPMLGSLSLLAEPAWSDTRGWPQVCSSYQNRALFANTASLPNGFWASVINDYSDFGNLTTDDDDAIAWFPTSNDINFIRFIVPYRSITVHTNSGIYSSPLSDVSAITPTNFTLQLQDSTPADVLLPQAIDNQILVLSGNDAHQMLWDGINNAYTSDIVSVINEQVIRSPVDETAFADLRRAGSRYVFITNDNGTLAVFQTLISQNVQGFTPQIMEQSYGNAYFRQTCSSSNGRAWFVIERQIASADTPVAISGFTSSTLTAVASNLSTTQPTAVTFTTSGSLPTSVPQIEVSTYYFAMGVDADTFKVYLNQDDALADVDEIEFSSAGTSSNVVPWPLTTIFTMEELTTEVFLDCAIKYSGSPTDTVTTGTLFNAQEVKMVGDGFGFEAIGVGNQVTFEAHGMDVDVSEAYIGFPITTIMQPMPLSIATAGSAKTTGLTKPTRVRSVRFMFNNTIGGTVNGIPIALEPFDASHIGEPPFPARGVFEIFPMNAWDDMNNPTYTIEHSEPFNIELLGVFYSVDI